MSKQSKTFHGELFCIECQTKVKAQHIKGDIAYPHRPDLFDKNFWQCPHCKNFVGTHHKGTSMSPLGHIPNKEIKNARIHIHRLLDPLWQEGPFKRSDVYRRMTKELGWGYHTAKIKSIEEAREVYKTARLVCYQLKKELYDGNTPR